LDEPEIASNSTFLKAAFVSWSFAFATGGLMDNSAAKESYLYCGVHRRSSMTTSDAERQDGLGTVWQRDDTTVFLNWNQTMFADGKLGVSEAAASDGFQGLISAYAAINNGHKRLEDFPVHPSCGIPVAANAKPSNKQAVLKPSAFRPSV
jgi:hypothetical protein